MVEINKLNRFTVQPLLLRFTVGSCAFVVSSDLRFGAWCISAKRHTALLRLIGLEQNHPSLCGITTTRTEGTTSLIHHPVYKINLRYCSRQWHSISSSISHPPPTACIPLNSFYDNFHWLLFQLVQQRALMKVFHPVTGKPGCRVHSLLTVLSHVHYVRFSFDRATPRVAQQIPGSSSFHSCSFSSSIHERTTETQHPGQYVEN